MNYLFVYDLFYRGNASVTVCIADELTTLAPRKDEKKKIKQHN